MTMINIVHKLRLARGRNAKIAILEQHKHDACWKRYLCLVYDKSINYGVRSIQDKTFVDDANCEDLCDALEELIIHSDKSFAAQMSKTFGELFRLALGRSLRCGVTATTINKVYGNIIPEFKVMLANNVPLEAVKLPALASIKFDGVRLVAFVCMGNVTLKTRSGKDVTITSIQDALCDCDNGVYDGELTFASGKQVERTSITGAVNRCLLGDAMDIKGAVFNVFDYVDSSDWASQRITKSYKKRLKRVKALSHVSGKIQPVEQIEVKTLKAINKMYAKVMAEGYEGLILRYKDDVYKWKRSNSLIKVKAKNHCLLKCVDVTEGKGKYEGMIGALRCEGLVEGKLVSVKVGTGLSDHDREYDDNHYVDKFIDIEYNDVVKDEHKDVYSLFLPVFKRIANEVDT